MEYSKKFGFVSDGTTIIFDNYANAKKLSEEDMFTDKIEPIISNGVATTVGKYTIPKSIDTVIWSWNDDEEQLHKNKLNNVPYFTDSLVKLPSATILAESIIDNERTWVLTKRKYSIFTLYFGKYKMKIDP